MGAVYLAEDTKLHRKVALKVLPAEMASNAERLSRFQREAQAVAALNHPHIVTIHSVEEAEGIHFITLELVEGDSLDHVLPPGGLPLAKVFDIGIALSDALSAAHEKGIIHRDLKPANVMVTRDGRVKVLDFGLAKLAPGAEGGAAAGGAGRLGPANTSLSTAMAGTASSPALTDAGMVMGTAPYMSPEQVSGEPVDARTDIFSLGVVLYEMATGRRPFGGKNKAETISSILRDAPRPLSEARQDAPRHLARIVDHCLQKDPEARFQTAKDVRNELRVLRKEVESETSSMESHPSAPAIRRPEGMPGVAAHSAPGSTQASAPSAQTSTVSGTTVSTARPWIWAVIGGVVVMVVVAAFWSGRWSGKPGPDNSSVSGSAKSGVMPPAVPETNSLAVLPFTNMSPDKDQEYFSDGLTEELLNALAKIPDLKVAGRTSSFSFKGKNEDLRTIGEKLGVANILEGSVRKSGNKVRITAQLVKVADGFHLWSETYDRTLDDIFAVQDDIGKAVAQALQVTLLGKGAGAKSPNAEAYDLVLQARFVMEVNNKEAIRRAREMLERALKQSPDYAPAWAEMGIAHARDMRRASTVEDRRRALGEGLKVLARALELDPKLAVAASRLATFQQSAWEFTESERSTEQALASAPKDPAVLTNAAIVYTTLGKYAEAIPLAEQAFKIDPLGIPSMVNLAEAYSSAGRVDDAAEVLRRAIELRPDSPFPHAEFAWTQLLQGNPGAARSSFAKFNELAGLGDWARLRGDALVEHTAGNAEASKRAAAEFEKRFGATDPVTCAQIHAWRGDTNAAFTWLDKGLAARDPNLPSIKSDPVFNSLRSDPRWNALLKKIGLPPD